MPVPSLMAVLLLVAIEGEVPLESKLLATIPDELSLTSAPVPQPDGSSKPDVVHPVFSADGARVAYVAWKGAKSFPVIDSTVSSAGYDYAGAPVFSANGASVGFRVGNRLTKSTERWWVHSDSGLSKPTDWMGEIAALPQGGFTYWTQPGAKIGDDGAYRRSDMRLMIGNHTGGKFEDAETAIPPRVSADGSIVATVAMKAGRWFPLKVGKKEQLLGKGVGLAQGVAISRDGKRVAYEALASNGSADPTNAGAAELSFTVYVDDVPIRSGFDAAGCAVFSPDGKVVGYKVRSGEKLGVATTSDPQPKAWYAFVCSPVWSGDGRRMAYVAAEGATVEREWATQWFGEDSARGGSWFVVVPGVEPASKHQHVRGLSLSHDGAHVAYAARDDDRWSIVVDGDAGDETYDFAGPPVFSRDGATVAFGVRKERELWWIVREVHSR